ncbi:MAG: DUF3105 domain-containing protein [Caldilineaceae bacterium]
MANTKKSTASPPAMRSNKRTRSKRNDRSLTYIIAGAAALFLLLVGLAVYSNIRQVIPIDGQESFNTQGNEHISNDTPNTFAYNSTPPTSGPHYGSLAPWGVYSEPQSYEYLVHNLEDGGVVIYYQCPDGCADTVTALEKVVQPYLNGNRHVVLAPNDPSWVDASWQSQHKDMGALIALTAWGNLFKLDAVDEDRIRAFIDKYEGIDHHTGVSG